MGARVRTFGEQGNSEARLLGGGLRGEELQALLDVSRGVRVPTRTAMSRWQDDAVLLLLHGTAKCHTVNRDGGEVITNIVGSGYAAGLVAALGHGSSGVTFTSLEPLEALVIAGPDLRRLVTERPMITAACLRTVARQHAHAHEERARFAGTYISERVAQRLLELAVRWGHRDGDHVHISLPITQEELAAWSDASRESVAKVLQNMRATGMIATGRRSLTILDLARLRARCQALEIDDPRPLAVARA